MKKKTLVLGASLKSNRVSNSAIKRLLDNGHPVEGIGHKKGEVNNVLIEIKPINFKGVHTVSLYLNPKNQAPYYDYILSLEPKRVIFNPGTENYELVKLLKENKIEVEIACTLVLLTLGVY